MLLGALGATAFFLRLRKVRRDVLRRRWTPLNESAEVRSPSFRLVGSDHHPDPETPPIQRPRIESTAGYVFGENLDESVSFVSPPLRHDRALSRAGRRRRSRRGPVALGVVLVLAVVVFLVS